MALKAKYFLCVGYEGHVCGLRVKRTGYFHKRCSACAKKVHDIRSARNNVANPEKHLAAVKRWQSRNKKKIRVTQRSYASANYEKIKAENRQWWSEHTELRSVKMHYFCIFSERSKCDTYKGMPFFDGWNPHKGGSYQAGEDWIIKTLGKRPKGTSLHIVHHDVGFWPGNLEWTYPKKQSNQQMFKIIAQQRHRIKELEAQLAQAQQSLAIAA